MEQIVYTNEGKVLLREAIQDDVPKIVELYEELPKNEYWEAEELAQSHYDLIEETNGTTYVAVLGEEVIGHTEVVLPNTKDKHAFLIKLQIKDDLRRRKFGIELVRYSMIMVKKEGYLGYAVWPDADKSKGLFKKLGLEEIKTNQEIKFKVKEEMPSVSGEVLEEIETVEDLKEFRMVVGYKYAPDFVWNRGFKLAKQEVLNYKTPIIKKVSVEGGEGIIFCDNRNLFIAVPEAEEENAELISDLVKYGSQIAKDADELLTYIDSDIWEIIKEEFDDYWEIEMDKARLEMKMEFE
ncbi:GNAT family N-acetyltransferase [Selenihalanaerobacter shriftii]|uniref:N-acetyltransferase domain-containing protein n=1 Tax=Selenihalanaerobacter shriftii TaxID=142842 RepID=A0A1T4JJA3_9FIRM|nr:GNAT family N-acetyltransferase [Selenihalanaerobacter shriftii]SJZ30231.1 hypothetical protein SAMN02745118_00013 [Selenihalanaerobacter shriftii]